MLITKHELYIFPNTTQGYRTFHSNKKKLRIKTGPSFFVQIISSWEWGDSYQPEKMTAIMCLLWDTSLFKLLLMHHWCGIASMTPLPPESTANLHPRFLATDSCSINQEIKPWYLTNRPNTFLLHYLGALLWSPQNQIYLRLMLFHTLADQSVCIYRMNSLTVKWDNSISADLRKTFFFKWNNKYYKLIACFLGVTRFLKFLFFLYNFFGFFPDFSP